MLGASYSPEEVVAYKALFQELCDIFTWSYTEILGLDPSIMEHHINTWTDVAPICQKQRPIHPSKVAAVKAEIKNLRTISFIYPIAYTTWVSNPVPVNKKEDTIHVCTKFRDLNGDVPKTTSQHPSLIRLSMHASDMKSFPSWTGFLDITKSISRKKIITRVHSQPCGAHSLIE